MFLTFENGEEDVLRHVLEMSRYCRGFVISVFLILLLLVMVDRVFFIIEVKFAVEIH